jgi:MFS family permease
LSGARRLLRLRSFRLLWSGHVVASFGDALTSLALVLLAYRLTGSTVAVAGAAIALALPQLLVGLPAGVLVDRWDRRRVMIASDLLRAVLVLGFLLVVSSGSLWLLYLIAFLQAGVGSFFNPARGALLADVVPAEQLLAANSLSETGRVVAGVAGVAAAGALAGTTGSLGIAFVVNSATFAASAALVAGVRTPPMPAVTSGHSGIWRDLLDGLALMTGTRRLLGVLVAATIVMFGLSAANVLVVPFVVDTLAASEAWFGPLRAALVASMVLAGALLAALGDRLRPTTLISGGLAGIGLGVALIATASTPWHLLLLYFAVGWFVTPVQAAVSTILQTEVPARARGRAQATFATTVGGASLLSLGLAGAAAEVFGIRLVFVLCGAVALAAAVASAAVFRSAAPTSEKESSCPSHEIAEPSPQTTSLPS